MTNVLFSWVGNSDLEKFEKNDEPTKGPLALAVLEREFDEVHVASDYTKQRTAPYFTWLRSKSNARIEEEKVDLKNPSDYRSISEYVHRKLERLKKHHPDMKLTIHLSPGTPAMAAVSILVGSTLYSAKFLQSSPKSGLIDADIPFDISATILLERSQQALFDSGGKPPSLSSHFEKIIGESRKINEAKQVAQKFAPYNIPVLILGDSGTGKELFAKAIFNSDPNRKASKFKIVNCATLDGGTINTTLFGYDKGAFTDALKEGAAGIFESCDGGTVFLDELGELPLETQARLLRVLQEGTITRLGSNKEIKIDVRIIAATNSDLSNDIARKTFREDLFHRVAVGVVSLPPICEREGDIKLLTEYFMNSICDEHGLPKKTLEPKALNVILTHRWPGNVRELQNALTRAYVLCDKKTIDYNIMSSSIINLSKNMTADPTTQLETNYKGLDLEIEDLERERIELALKMFNNKKNKAAEYLKLGSHQTLTNKMKKLGLDKNILIEK